MRLRIPDWVRYEIRHWWERLGIIRWSNHNRKTTVGITAGLTLLFLAVIIGQVIPEKTPRVEESNKAWFYDLDTHKLFPAKADMLTSEKMPGVLSDGREPSIVRAYVFSYVYDPNESERFIGFLEMTDPNTRQQGPATSNGGSGSLKRWAQGRLIRKVDDGQWVPANSNEGLAILREVFSPNEKGQVAQYCPPRDRERNRRK